MSYHIVSAQELAEKLRMSSKTMYKLLNAGKIPGSRKIGGLWYIRIDIFEASFEKPTPAKFKAEADSKNRHSLL